VEPWIANSFGWAGAFVSGCRPSGGLLALPSDWPELRGKCAPIAGVDWRRSSGRLALAIAPESENPGRRVCPIPDQVHRPPVMGLDLRAHCPGVTKAFCP
jgi:hypothetical protein